MSAEPEALAVQEMPTPALALPLLISADELARLLDCSATHIWRMHSGGKLPKPVKIGRLTRWREAEVSAWVETGAPSRNAWHWTGGRL